MTTSMQDLMDQFEETSQMTDPIHQVFVPGQFNQFPKIGRQSDAMTYRARNNLQEPLKYRAKIKLHGTNGGLHFLHDGRVTACQSRKRVLSFDADNYGFYSWMRSWWQDHQAPRQSCPFLVMGEWAGPGVQDIVSVSMLPEKAFFAFAILFADGRWVIEPDGIHSIVGHIPGIYVLPWHEFPGCDSVGIETMHPLTFTGGAEVAAAVNAIDDEDPYIKEQFGISGVGEGLVLYPDKYTDSEHFGDLLFKVKGTSHQKGSGKKQKVEKPALTPEMYASIQEFVASEVHEGRLQQGFQEVCDGVFDIRKTGPFIGWVCRDVQEETVNEREVSGITWKICGSVVADVARAWYMKQNGVG